MGVTKWDKKQNTEPQSTAGVEMVDVMMMRRRLCWLGHGE